MEWWENYFCKKYNCLPSELDGEEFARLSLGLRMDGTG